jgi:ProP effector
MDGIGIGHDAHDIGSNALRQLTSDACRNPLAAPCEAAGGFRSNCYNPRIFLVVDGIIMGFEQLAALKEQLAKQAEEKRAARKAKHARPDRAAPAQGRGAPAQGQSQSQGRAAAGQGQGRAVPAQGQGRAAAAQGQGRAAPAQSAKPVDPVVLTIGKLQKRFPKAFPRNPAPKVPLKIGIFEDLLQHAEALKLSEAQLRDAIKVWCWGSRYWASVVENAARVDLNGESTGQVQPGEAARARGLQARRQKAKNAAQRTQKNDAAVSSGGNALSAQAAPDHAPAQEGAQPQGAAQADAAPQETALAENTAAPETGASVPSAQGTSGDA